MRTSFVFGTGALESDGPISQQVILKSFSHVLSGIYVYVCFFASTSRYYVCQFPASSWEFFMTLDYEFDIIRGRRPYRWTIWVRNGGPSLVPTTHPRHSD